MVVLNEADAQARAAQDVDAGVPGNPAKNDRQGRTVLAVAAALIVVAALVGWMFHGFALVRLVLPDTSAAAPSAPPRAQLKSASTAQQLYVWLAQVEAPLDALLVVRNNIAAAAANNDSAGIQRACESGQVIVPRVQEHLPSPDSA
ncbi:MAG: hypothetical protein P4L86_13300, partial [Mycobacterium sp.]|nr:hypothetical protein [Mycobacterium sp.]